MFIALQLADNLPCVTTKKRERCAAAQAKQVVGTGKHKRSSNKSQSVLAKRHHIGPSPDVVPMTSSVDRQRVDDVFASKQKSTVTISYTLMSDY